MIAESRTILIFPFNNDCFSTNVLTITSLYLIYIIYFLN
jgi:hypothetical protein